MGAPFQQVLSINSTMGLGPLLIEMLPPAPTLTKQAGSSSDPSGPSASSGMLGPCASAPEAWLAGSWTSQASFGGCSVARLLVVELRSCWASCLCVFFIPSPLVWSRGGCETRYGNGRASPPTTA